MKKTGSTIDITPDPEGIIRWLRACYRGDDAVVPHQEHALMVMRAGWPTLDEAGAIDVLTGKTELVECIERERQARLARENAVDVIGDPMGNEAIGTE